MSAQAGIFYFDRRPIHAEEVESLDRGLALRGPDGGSSYVGDGLAMVYRAFHISREDRLEHQPSMSPAGVVMTWDGRLDNREDLLLQLGSSVEDTSTDVALALACYERWGENGLSRLIGDWSLAVWDPTSRALLLASDYMGPRPLYYHRSARRVIWSSSLEALVRLVGCDNDLERRYIAGFLIAGPPAELTPYSNVLSVPPTYCLRFDAHGACERRRFWNYDPGTIRYKDDMAYEEHLRQVFREAIRSRLRVDGPVWAELSGGWDSSSVVCMAREVIRSTSVQARSLHTISYVSDTSAEAGERQFIEAVEHHCALEGYHVNQDDYPFTPATSWVTPMANQTLALRMRESVAQHGGRLVLTGRAGDATMGAFRDYSVALADTIASAQPIDYVRHARAWSLATKQPFVAIVPKSLRLLLPHRIQERLRWRSMLKKAATGRAGDRSLKHLYAVSPALATEIEEVYGNDATPLTGIWPPSKRDLAGMLLGSSTVRRFIYPDARPPVEFTHPYVDRRVVEYILAIPTAQWCGPGDPRSLMRRAFSGFLPLRVSRRFSKGYAQPSIGSAVRDLTTGWTDRLRDLEVIKAGYVSADDLVELLHLLSGSVSVGNMVSIVRLEAWLVARRAERERRPYEALFDHGPAARQASSA